ncbi:MAG: neutral/alkaline non-lysosomal ceramidase N-terminal domain-containing protein, partial [bacterium]
MIKLGTARINITPTEPVDLAGFIARVQPMTGIHDPLYASTLVIEQQKDKFVYIVCDLLNLSRPGVAYFREKIQERTGIPANQIMISCTHTHSGPIATFVPPAKQGGPAINPRRKNLGTLNQKYTEELTENLQKLVTAAIEPQHMTEIDHIEYFSGTIEGLNIDRRAEAGKKGIHGPLVTHTAETDTSLQVVTFMNKQNKIKAVLVNFACHAMI